MVMFNSVVFHLAVEFVSVERWTVVSFQDVGISESAKKLCPSRALLSTLLEL